MKKLFYLLLGIALATGATTAYAIGAYPVQVGGTGTTSPSGILYGDNGSTTHLNTVSLGANCTFVAGVLNCTGGGGGSGTVGTSTHETAGQVPYWTTTSGTPALLGSTATSTPSVTYPFLYSGTLGNLIGGASGTFSLAFGTTTANTWSSTQTFSSPIVVEGNTGIASTTPASSLSINEKAGTPTQKLLDIADKSNNSLFSVATSSVTLVGIGATTSPGSLLSIGGTGTGINFYDNATSTFQKTVKAPCFSTDGTTCLTSGGTGTVTSVGALSGDNSISITGTNPITTSGTLGIALRLANPNNWTGLQTFTNASSTQHSFTGKTYFGATATTTINADGVGSIVVPSSGSITASGLGTAAGTFVAADPNGKLIATSTPSSGAVPAGSSGQIQFNSGSNTLAADANLFWDNVKKLLGIGSSTPFARLAIDNSTASPFGISSSTQQYATLGTVNISGTSAVIATTTLQYTSSTNTFTVPANVTSVMFKGWGAGGYSTSYGGAGGAGAYVAGYISVTAGDTITAVVGTGSSGGGSQTVTYLQKNGVDIAYIGGGGDAGQDHDGGSGGAVLNGGAGGNLVGGSGVSYPGCSGSGGGGGTQSAGGSGGNGCSGQGSGSPGSGHNGGSGGPSGGHGGTGYFGGGGGGGTIDGIYSVGAAGGGGSSWLASTLTSTSTATSTTTTAPNSGDSLHIGSAGNGGAYTHASYNNGSNGEWAFQYQPQQVTTQTLNIGIGTTTPSAGFSMERGEGSGVVEMITGFYKTVKYIWFELGQYGEEIFGGVAPTATCGSVTGNSVTGYIAGSGTSCTVQWANPYPVAKLSCNLTNSATGITFGITSASSTGFAFSTSAGMGTVYYRCAGLQ